MAKFIFEYVFSFIFAFVALPVLIACCLGLMGIFLCFLKELAKYFKNETKTAVLFFKARKDKEGECKRYKTLAGDIFSAYLIGDIGLLMLLALLALAITPLVIFVPMAISIIQQPFTH